jgi:hypothetical protein
MKITAIVLTLAFLLAGGNTLVYSAGTNDTNTIHGKSPAIVRIKIKKMKNNTAKTNIITGKTNGK